LIDYPRLDGFVVAGERVHDIVLGHLLGFIPQDKRNDFDRVKTNLSNRYDSEIVEAEAESASWLSVEVLEALYGWKLHSIVNSYIGGDNSAVRIADMLESALLRFEETAECHPSVSSLVVTTVTSGSGSDVDGYRVNLDDVLWEDIGVDGSVMIVDVPEGEHVVTLEDVALNCTVEGDNPRSVIVPAGGVAETTFNVDCVEAKSPVSIAAGNTHSCAVSADASGYCWGNASGGALGNGATAGSFSAPDSVRGGLAFMSIVAGAGHSCGLTADSVAYCWGLNNWGQLGIGTTSSLNPLPLPVSGNLKLSKVTAGDSHTCAITNDEEAYCWGANGVGQVGDGTTVGRTTPVPVAGGYSFVAISAGAQHTCGITTGGTTYCWGNGASGRLGNGATGIEPEPVVVSGDQYFRSVSAGGHHTCGLADDAHVYCWGANSNGELGDNSAVMRLVPTPVHGEVSYTAVFAGGWHSCAVATDGAAYCWGYNASGELGNGTTASASIPVPVSGSLAFTQLSGHGYVAGHTCGITEDGEGYCWGSNQYGKLGDGTTTASLVPTRISPLP
jgi:alpha-tubulin suppressor-like RCC1 family protein